MHSETNSVFTTNVPEHNNNTQTSSKFIKKSKLKMLIKRNIWRNGEVDSSRNNREPQHPIPTELNVDKKSEIY